jgi:putative transposase
VSFALDVDDEHFSEKPAIDELEASDCVGVDLGIRNYIHTSNGVSVGQLDLVAEYEQLRKAQRTLSCWNTEARTVRNNASESLRLNAGFAGRP